MQQIKPQEIEYKKEVGTLDGAPVIEVGLKGGYHMLCTATGSKVEYLGVGPHRAVARFMAQKRHRSLKITELSKSEWIDPSHFEHVIPQYETLLVRLNAASK